MLEGIDINDKERAKEITRKRRLQQANEIMVDNKNNLNPTRNIKEIHNAMNGINQQIDLTQKTISSILKEERKLIWSELDKKLTDIKEMIRKEQEKKKDDQYDYHQKEKELTEHLETMTQVAQDVDNKNRKLTKENQELKIQYMSQENDRDLLIR